MICFLLGLANKTEDIWQKVTEGANPANTATNRRDSDKLDWQSALNSLFVNFNDQGETHAVIVSSVNDKTVVCKSRKKTFNLLKKGILRSPHLLRQSLPYKQKGEHPEI